MRKIGSINYSWIVIAILVLSIIIVLSILFVIRIKGAFWRTPKGPFELNDMADNGGFEYDTFATTSDHAGTPIITTEANNSLGHSLKCFGNTSIQKYTDQWFQAGKYYVACKIRVDRYVRGYAGILVNGGGNHNVPIIKVKNTTNNKFITASGIFETNGKYLKLFYGTINSANIDCYIDDLVIVPLSAFEAEPSIEELNIQYEKYISSRKIKDTINPQYIFMKKVNEKAQSLGMANSMFATPSGINPYAAADDLNVHYSTAEDILKLSVAAYQNDTLRNFASASTKDISIKGDSARTIHLESTCIGNGKSKYKIMFGKTGTIGKTVNITAITEINGKTVIGVIMGATTRDKRFVALDELFDLCTNILSNNYHDTTTITNAHSAIACVLTDDSYEIIYEQNKDTRYTPASITKVITLLTALDYIKNFKKEITIIHNDITPGSGPAFFQGDKISYSEAFYSMMLPSSNTLATAVARHIGTIISK